MLLQSPMNEIVQWNPEEKIIGVVGVAPSATADFYQKMIQLTPVKKDWEHVRVIIDSNPKIPSRGRYLELDETDPVPYIQQAIQNLGQMGASIVAVPCNTAHILYHRYTENVSVIVPNMIEATKEAVLQACPNTPQSVAVFASKLTQQHRLYHDSFNSHGIKVLDTSAHQTEISTIIEAVKQGRLISELSEKMNAVFSAYMQADVFILGCTELSLLAQNNFAGIPMIDSNVALAMACLTLSKNNAFKRENLSLLKSPH